jgi:outer membrane protein assembly factor BamB
MMGFMRTRLAGRCALLCSLVVSSLSLVACGGDGNNGSGSSTSTAPPTPITLSSVAPNAAVAGSGSVVITATGSGYSTTSNIEWNGVALSTNFVSVTSLTATVPASDLTVPGTASLSVVDSANGGMGSAVTNFTVTEQTAPAITTLAPNAAVFGGQGFQLTVAGTGFAPSAQVLWDGSALPTTFDSATQLTAQVSTSLIANLENASVTVVNDSDAGGTSNVSTFPVMTPPPQPTVTSILPASAHQNGSNVTFTLTGTNFTPTTVVYVNSAYQQPTYISATQMSFTMGTVPYNTQPLEVQVAAVFGAVLSNPVSVTLVPPVPVIFSLSPSTLIAQGPAVSVAVQAQNATSTAIVYFNGSARPTSMDLQGNLIVQLSASDVANAGSDAITVVDPASGNTPSNPANLTVSPLPALMLSKLAPATVPVGSGSFYVSVYGNGFTTNSAVLWNGNPLTTNYVSVTQLRAQVSTSQVASLGSATVQVENPANQGGTAAQQLTLTVGPRSLDAVSYQIDNAHTGAISFQNISLPAAASWSIDVGGPPSYSLIVNGIVYVMAATNGNSQLFALNAQTGATVWGPIAFSGAAGLTYDSGSIFVNSGSYITAGIITALDATTGTQRWSATTPGTFATQSPLVAARGIVYALDDGEMTAFDETNGALLWTQSVTGTNGSVAVTLDGVYASPPCTSTDVDPITGSILWTINTGCEGGGGATPVVANGQFYSPNSPGFYGGIIYDAETHAVLGAFNDSTLPAISATYAVSLYNSTLQATSLANNQVLWSFAGDATLNTPAVIVSNYVFVGSGSGNLYALDAAAGTVLWTQALGAGVPGGSGLSAGDGYLVVPSGTSVKAFLLSASP